MKVGLSLLLAGAVAPAVSGQQAPIDTTGAPVVVSGDTLFRLYGRLGAFTPGERAAGVVRRVTSVARGLRRGADSLVVVDAETHTDILFGEVVLATVLNADVRDTTRTRAVVAQEYAERLTTSMRAMSRETTVNALLVGALRFILAATGLAVALRLIARLFPKAIRYLETRGAARMPALRIQRLVLLTSEQLTRTLVAVLSVSRTVAVILLLYFFVPLVLSFFPWTAPLADRIVGYVVSPLSRAWSGFVAYLPNVFFIGVTAVLTHYVLRFVRLFFVAVGRGAIVLPGFYREWWEPTYKIVRVLVFAFVVVIVFPYLPGAGSAAFNGISIFLGALLTLGSSSAIANIVAGTVLTYTRAFNIGDRVTIGQTTGDVVERTLLVTRVRTIKRVDTTIPNAAVLSSHITNYSTMARDGGIILHTTVTISYDVPWRQVHELLIGAARATDGISAEPAPFVLQTSLDDFYVSYQVNATTERADAMAGIYSRLHENIQDAFRDANVEIMSPHYRANRDGTATTIPE